MKKSATIDLPFVSLVDEDVFRESVLINKKLMLGPIVPEHYCMKLPVSTELYSTRFGRNFESYIDRTDIPDGLVPVIGICILATTVVGLIGGFQLMVGVSWWFGILFAFFCLRVILFMTLGSDAENNAGNFAAIVMVTEVIIAFGICYGFWRLVTRGSKGEEVHRWLVEQVENNNECKDPLLVHVPLVLSAEKSLWEEAGHDLYYVCGPGQYEIDGGSGEIRSTPLTVFPDPLLVSFVNGKAYVISTL